MYHVLQQLFSRVAHAERRRGGSRRPRVSFETSTGHQLESRRLLAVAPLPDGVAAAQQFNAAYVSTVSIKAAMSAAVAPVAPVTVPTAPTSVKVQAGIGQATLMWSEPTSSGSSVITRYEISYKIEKSRTWSAPLSVPATSRTAVVADLSNGITYLFRVVAVNTAGVGSETIVSATPTNPANQATVRFLKAGTLPVTVQLGYSVLDANGNRQAKFKTVSIGSLATSGSIAVPDFDKVNGAVTVTVTVRNLPRGMTKSQSFALVKKTNYSIGISYDTRVSDPWSATTIRCG